MKRSKLKICKIAMFSEKDEIGLNERINEFSETLFKFGRSIKDIKYIQKNNDFLSAMIIYEYEIGD